VIASLLPGVDHLQNLHPVVVHFPVALLPGAVALYFLAWIARRESWAWVGLWMLVLGAVGAAVAVATGLYGAEGVMLAPSVKQHLLFFHKRIMLAVLGLSVLLSLWALFSRPIPERGRLAFLGLLLVLTALLVKGADYGGRIVFDYNGGGDACGQPIEFAH
jgi:uncharacterized membrane protein